MITNLVDYFLPEQEFYLDKIVYNRIEKNTTTSEYALNYIDDMQFDIAENYLKMTVTRTLKFEPEEVFDLSVSFGVILKFNKEKKDEYDWKKIDLGAEFIENGQFVLGNLMNRISLLIGQITSSFGQPPIVLPPGIAAKDE